MRDVVRGFLPVVADESMPEGLAGRYEGFAAANPCGLWSAWLYVGSPLHGADMPATPPTFAAMEAGYVFVGAFPSLPQAMAHVDYKVIDRHARGLGAWADARRADGGTDGRTGSGDAGALTPVERDLLRWCLLDDVGQNLVQSLSVPETTREDVGETFERLDAALDASLVAEFNAMVDQVFHGSSGYLPYYEAMRPETRAGLSRVPIRERLCGTKPAEESREP